MSLSRLIGSERLLSPDELHELLGVPKRTIRDWGTKGTGPKRYRLNHKTTRYRIEDVREWLAEKYAA